MKLIFWIALLILTPRFALSEPLSHSQIFNFTPKKIYYTVKESSETGKIKPYKSKTVHYSQKQIHLSLYRSYGRLSQACQVNMTDKHDVFVSGERGLICKRRAERIPKEFP